MNFTRLALWGGRRKKDPGSFLDCFHISFDFSTPGGPRNKCEVTSFVFPSQGVK